MNKEMIVAAVIGMLLVVVAFALFIPLNRATGNLYNFFQDSCQDRNSRFNKVFVGVTAFPSPAGTSHYNTSTDVFSGPGTTLTGTGNKCNFPTIAVANGTGSASATSATLYNEFGEQIATIASSGMSSGAVTGVALGSGYQWYKPSEILGDFIGICRTLISLSPVIVVAGFLTLAGTGLVRYGMGVGSGGIAGAISAGVIALVINIAVMYLAPIGINSVVKAGQYTQTGALAVNQEFGDVQRLLFAVIPLIMIAVIIGSNALAGGLQFGMGSRFKRAGSSMMGI